MFRTPGFLIAEGVIPIVLGVLMLAAGFRLIGTRRGTDLKTDNWYAKYGWFYKAGGLIGISLGSFKLFLYFSE